MSEYKSEQPHSSAWVAQTWISFIVATGMTALGIFFLPGATFYAKGYLGMGLLFTVGSSLSLAKTIRDQHEAERVVKQINQAKIQKILNDHDPIES